MCVLCAPFNLHAFKLLSFFAHNIYMQNLGLCISEGGVDRRKFLYLSSKDKTDNLHQQF